ELLADREAELPPAPYFRARLTASGGRDRFPQQGGRLWLADALGGPSARHPRGQTSCRQARSHRRPAHMGTDAHPPSPRSLPRPRRRRCARRPAMGREPSRTSCCLSTPCQKPSVGCSSMGSKPRSSVANSASSATLPASLNSPSSASPFVVYAKPPAHSGDLERSIRSIMNTDSGDHEHPLALA